MKWDYIPTLKEFLINQDLMVDLDMFMVNSDILNTVDLEIFVNCYFREIKANDLFASWNFRELAIARFLFYVKK